MRSLAHVQSRLGREMPHPEPPDFGRFFSKLGPGLITGAADDDPSGISTYSVAGAAFGYLPLWTALFSFPLMTAVQLMCARLGVGDGSRPRRRDPPALFAVGALGRLRAAGRRERHQHRRRSRRHGGSDHDGDRRAGRADGPGLRRRDRRRC